VKYGKGLQLINILRDAGSDLQQGRCYFPADELDSLGVKPENILEAPDKIETILKKWRDAASAGLDAGIDYACAIRNSRVRAASVLPALIGARTLALLGAAGPNALRERVKVSRTEVQSLMIWAVTPFATSAALRKKYQRLAATAP
jgi:farnesyl-diphosphate farnesyltransferase